ncbi:hypothetical protein SAMN05216346_10537 [Streptococcus equinus]|nr:hypothetical protein SAMN05216346_10537 [Streptococcus equinus]
MLKLWARLAILVKKRVRDSIIAKIALVLSLVVVFCTTYLLILPALTISTGNSSSVFQSSESASSQVESPTDDSQKENNQTEAPSQASPTESSQEKKDMSQAGTLTAETSDVTVTVSYEGNTFTEPVQLKVKPVSDTTDIDNKLTSLLSESKQSLSQAHSYDISFVTDDGKEVEPSKDVKVSMAFKNDLSTSDDKQAGWKLYHFVDNDVNQVQDLTESSDTDIKETGDGAVESVDFKSDSFSYYTIVGVAYDFSGYLTSGSYDTSATTLDLATKQVKTKITLNFDNLPASELQKYSNPTFYLALPDSVIVKTDETYNILDKAGNPAGNFHFTTGSDGKYYMLIQFNDDYVNKLSSGATVAGNLFYNMNLKEVAEQNNGDYVADFSDKVRVTVKEDTITKNYDISTQKWVSKTDYDSDGANVTYTVRVDSKYGTPGDIDLTDSLSASGISISAVTDVSITKSTYAGDTGHVTGTEAVSKKPKFDQNNKKWTLTLPQLVSGGTDSNGNPIGHFYTITYRYKFTGLSAGKPVQVNNEVKVVSKDKSSSGNASVTLNLNDIQKQGKYDPKTGLISWKITVNPKGNNIGGAVLKDSFLKKATDVKISPDKDYCINYDSEGKINYIKFTGNPNTQSYTITYNTKADTSGWAPDNKNTVILDGDGNTGTTGDQTSASDNPKVPEDGKLEKTSLGEDDTSDTDVKTLSWQTKITMPSTGVIEKGTIFKDVLKDSNNGQNPNNHWYTKAQLQDLYKELVDIFGGKDKFTLKARQYGQGAYMKYEDLEDIYYTEFQIDLKSDFKSSKDITIQYQSTAKLNGENTLDFTNTIKSAGHSSQAKYHHTDDSKVTKMDGDEKHATTQKVSTDGVVTWKVKVNLSDDAKSMTVKDTLPNGIHLTNLIFGCHYSQKSATINGNNISALTGQNDWGATNMKVDGSISGDNVVTLNFSTTDGRTLKQSIGDNDFWLTFTTVYDIPANKVVTETLTNAVSVSVDGKDYGSDSQTQEVTFENLIRKTQLTPDNSSDSNRSNSDNVAYSHVLKYSVDINPGAEDLASGADILTLTDTIRYRKMDQTCTLLQDSVELCDKDGKKVPSSDWSWTYRDDIENKEQPNEYHDGIITVKLPDSGHYTLKYNYQISGGNLGASANIDNTAKLEGINRASDSTHTNYTYCEQSGGGNVYSKGTYVINKVDSQNYSKGLKGAVFAIYDKCGNYIGETTPTDENGHTAFSINSSSICLLWLCLSWNKFHTGELYYFQEKEQPDGYELSHEKYYFYYNSCYDISDYDKLGAVNLARSEGTAYVPNQKTKQNLTVKKEWLKYDGTKTERTDGSITYDVIEVATNQCGQSFEYVYKAGEVLTHDDNWTRTYKNLPVYGYDAYGNKYILTYYVREKAVPGYDTVYSNGYKTSDDPVKMKIGAEDGQITIKNKSQKQYELPETGGSGVKMHYVIGASLALLSLGLIILKSYKAYQKGGDS